MRTGPLLPPVVDKGLVGLRHPMRVVPLLYRRALFPVRVDYLCGQALRHRAAGASARRSQDPPHRQRGLPGRTHLERNLVSSATHTTGPYFEDGHRIPHRLLEDHAWVFFNSLCHLVQRSVDDAFGPDLFAIAHHLVNHRLHPVPVVLGLGRRSMTDYFTAARHDASRSYFGPSALRVPY